MSYEAIVIGVSAGGIHVLSDFLPKLKHDLNMAVIIVQHLAPDSDAFIIDFFNKRTAIKVREAEDKMKICKRCIYFAPPNYHLLVEENRSFSLSSEERVNFSRPSIDVLFESASFVYGPSLIGIILTGANHDGSKGIEIIRKRGGHTLAQSPESAPVDIMPRKAIETGMVDKVLDISRMADYINSLATLSK